MRVLRILTRPNLGGPTRQAVALWHAHRELGVPTLLVTGRVDATESTLSPADAGVPVLEVATALQRGPDASGWVEVPELGRGLSPFAAAAPLPRRPCDDAAHDGGRADPGTGGPRAAGA